MVEENIKINRILDKKKNKIMYSISKRVIDIVGSLVGLVVLSPILVIIALLIRIDSPGKIVFGHKRIGKDKKEIKVYKFRTMYENSEEIFENFSAEQKKEYYINFKLDNDPRITKIGKILRETSLDEIPQLLNILKGEMSIVGPRPIIEDEIKKYNIYFDKFISVVPGLTGYWQANGRSDTTYEERVKMDMYYIDNRSLSLDIKIIFKTIASVIKKEGAV